MKNYNTIFVSKYNLFITLQYNGSSYLLSLMTIDGKKFSFGLTYYFDIEKYRNNIPYDIPDVFTIFYEYGKYLVDDEVEYKKIYQIIKLIEEANIELRKKAKERKKLLKN